MKKIYNLLADVCFWISVPLFRLGDYFLVKADGLTWSNLTPEEQDELDAQMEELAEAFAKSINEPHPQAPHLPS